MAIIVTYNPTCPIVNNRVHIFNPSAHGPEYDSESNKVVDPDLSLLWTSPDTFIVPQKYWKYDGVSDIVEMNQTEKDAVDASAISSTPFGDSSTVENTCKNTSGVTITRGTPVYISGLESTTNVPTIAKAEASNSAKMPAIGLAKEDIANNDYGYVVRLGVIDALDTSGTSVNDYVYVGGSGGFTTTAPSTEGDVHQRVGQIMKVDVDSGIIIVFMHDAADTDWLGGIEVDYTAKADDYALAYDSASGKITFQDLHSIVGASSTTISAWTLSTGDLYYGTFTHNLGTTDVSVFCYNTTGNKQVFPEDVEIVDGNNVKLWVRGNTHSVKVNVVTGRGPQGPTGAQGPAGADGADGGGLTDVVNDLTPELGGDLSLNQKHLQFSPSLSSDLTASGIMVSATVDANATGFGAALFLNSDGLGFDEADADAASTMPCRALALESGTGTKKILLQGFARKDAWNWTVGGDIFVSTTTGALTQAAPSGTGDQVQKVGFAWSADIIYFNPDYTVVEVS